MSISKIKEAAEGILDRVESVRGRGEEATKQAMILPMIHALGYDIWNPNEVCPEYEADVAIKKNGQKEKVDYAILLNGEPRIFIEAKALGESLDGHHGQLSRYFTSNKSVSVGILTNGMEYRFFTDTDELHLMDDQPFHTVKLDAIEQGIEVLDTFRKEVFSPVSIRDYATELTYTSKIHGFLLNELDVQDSELSDDFVDWIIRTGNIYSGRITSSVLERFKPIAKTSLKRVLNRIVRRLVTEIDAKISAPPPAISEEAGSIANAPQEMVESEVPVTLDSDVLQIPGGKKDIVTTEEELECFATIKRIYDNSAFSSRQIYEPGTKKEIPIELGYKDTTAYFNIYFNKPSWWNMRLNLDGKVKWIGFDVDAEVGKTLLPNGFELLPPTGHSAFRVVFNSCQDIFTLTELVFASFEKTIQDREKYRSNE